MKIRTLLRAALALLILPAAASAHGPQLQITNDGGQIVTRSVLVNDYSALSDEKSAYVIPVTSVLDTDFPTSWRATADESGAYPFGPGLAYGLGATFPTNSTLTISFLEELMLWDGGAFVSAGDVELAALRTSNPNASSLTGNTAVTGGPDWDAEVAIGDSYDSGAHASVTHVLLGDGVDPAAAVADGLYRAKLQIASSDASIAASDPIYLLLSKNANDQVGQAVASLGLPAGAVQYFTVPEPTTAALAALTLLAPVWRRRC